VQGHRVRADDTAFQTAICDDGPSIELILAKCACRRDKYLPAVDTVILYVSDCVTPYSATVWFRSEHVTLREQVISQLW
jgi:hypothetical protein